MSFLTLVILDFGDQPQEVREAADKLLKSGKLQTQIRDRVNLYDIPIDVTTALPAGCYVYMTEHKLNASEFNASILLQLSMHNVLCRSIFVMSSEKTNENTSYLSKNLTWSNPFMEFLKMFNV